MCYELVCGMALTYGQLTWRSLLQQISCASKVQFCKSPVLWSTDREISSTALRAAVAVKQEDDRRLFHNASLRKRRKEVGEHMEALKRLNKGNGKWRDGSCWGQLKTPQGGLVPICSK